jgi:AcrR family transcriptional regulator
MSRIAAPTMTDTAATPVVTAEPARPAGGATGPAGDATERTDGRSRRGTRARIQAVAVEMFTEHGYEKTSLREIAEALGVTKAALYYHFKSKEDIVRSLVEDYFGRVDALVSWGENEPPGPATRAEILRRYVAIVQEGEAAFRMLHQNQAAIKTLAGSKNTGELFRERLGLLIALLTGPGAGRRPAPRGDGPRRDQHGLDGVLRGGAGSLPPQRRRPPGRQRDRRLALLRAPAPASRSQHRQISTGRSARADHSASTPALIPIILIGIRGT